MGNPGREPDVSRESPQHQVTVSSFYLCRRPVTQKEYRDLMGTNPSTYKNDNSPVESICWYDAVEFCNLKSQQEGLMPAYTIDKSQSDPNNLNNGDQVKWLVTLNRNANGYRLPTEAEWEYACRAGTTTPFNTGISITTSQANYNGNQPYLTDSKGIYRESTTAVENFAPNSWGLYEMHGNVWEMCWDWYRAYPNDAQTDPLGGTSGAYRVSRGGSWHTDAAKLRSASRGNNNPVGRHVDVGFRLAANAGFN